MVRSDGQGAAQGTTSGQNTSQGQGFTLQDMNPNHLGMVEQLVCANAHTFIGTPLSTFTGFITRMRGFMNRTTVAGLPLPPPSSPPPSDVIVDQDTDKEQNKDKDKNKGKDKNKNNKVDPPKKTGSSLVQFLPHPQHTSQVGKLVPFDPSVTTPLSAEVGVGLYDRTFYFMKKFTYQLQDKPHLELPFWVREFSEPFEDTEDEEQEEYNGTT